MAVARFVTVYNRNRMSISAFFFCLLLALLFLRIRLRTKGSKQANPISGSPSSVSCSMRRLCPLLLLLLLLNATCVAASENRTADLAAGSGACTKSPRGISDCALIRLPKSRALVDEKAKARRETLGRWSFAAATFVALLSVRY